MSNSFLAQKSVLYNQFCDRAKVRSWWATVRPEPYGEYPADWAVDSVLQSGFLLCLLLGCEGSIQGFITSYLFDGSKLCRTNSSRTL